MWFFFGISPNNPPKDVARQSDMLMLPPCSRWHWGLAMKMPVARGPQWGTLSERLTVLWQLKGKVSMNMSSKSHEFSMFVTPWYSHYIPWMSHDFHPSSATPLYLHPRQHCSSWSSCCYQRLGDKTLVEWRFSMTKGVNGSGDEKKKGKVGSHTFPDLRVFNQKCILENLRSKVWNSERHPAYRKVAIEDVQSTTFTLCLRQHSSCSNFNEKLRPKMPYKWRKNWTACCIQVNLEWNSVLPLKPWVLEVCLVFSTCDQNMAFWVCRIL